MNTEFNVRVENGDVFINDKFISQLCFDGMAVGIAIGAYLDGNIGEKDE